MIIPLILSESSDFDEKTCKIYKKNGENIKKPSFPRERERGQSREQAGTGFGSESHIPAEVAEVIADVTHECRRILPCEIGND